MSTITAKLTNLKKKNSGNIGEKIKEMNFNPKMKTFK